MPTCHAAVRPPSIGLAASTLGRNSSRRRGIQRRSLVPGAPRLTLPYRLSLLRSRVKARTVESQRAGTGLGVQGLSQCVLSSRNAPLGELGHETPTHGVHADGTFPLRWSQHDGGLLPFVSLLVPSGHVTLNHEASDRSAPVKSAFVQSVRSNTASSKAKKCNCVRFTAVKSLSMKPPPSLSDLCRSTYR